MIFLKDISNMEEIAVGRQPNFEPGRLPRRPWIVRPVEPGLSRYGNLVVWQVPFDSAAEANKEALIFQVALSFHPAAHAFAGLGFLHPLFFSGLEIHGVFLNFLDDGFLLDSSLEPAQGAL
jgi:hypothetical protein